MSRGSHGECHEDGSRPVQKSEPQMAAGVGTEEGGKDEEEVPNRHGDAKREKEEPGGGSAPAPGQGSGEEMAR
ncbi:hypothetical protein KM043_004325 [Ampulex compressa]|nr:hypothetical protein KM043_004325 [Ampulex compressa]